MRINRLRLVTEMVRQDLTQKQLAEKAGISRATVNAVRCGRSCSDISAIKIADALGVRIEDLLEN